MSREPEPRVVAQAFVLALMRKRQADPWELQASRGYMMSPDLKI